MITTSWTLPMLPTQPILLAYPPTSVPSKPQQPVGYPQTIYWPQQQGYSHFVLNTFQQPIWQQTGQMYPVNTAVSIAPPIQQTAVLQNNTTQQALRVSPETPKQPVFQPQSLLNKNQEAMMMANILDDLTKKYPQFKLLLNKDKLQKLQQGINAPNQTTNDVILQLIGDPIRHEMQSKSWFRRRAAKIALWQLEKFLSRASMIPGPTQELFKDLLKRIQDPSFKVVQKPVN